MDPNKKKLFIKIAIGVVTVGVTATAIYFATKAIKKKMAEKKKAEDGAKAVPKVDVKKEISKIPSEDMLKANEKPAQAIAKKINDLYAEANAKRGGISKQENDTVQNWLTDMAKLGYKFDMEKKIAVRK